MAEPFFVNKVEKMVYYLIFKRTNSQSKTKDFEKFNTVWIFAKEEILQFQHILKKTRIKFPKTKSKLCPNSILFVKQGPWANLNDQLCAPATPSPPPLPHPSTLQAISGENSSPVVQPYVHQHCLICHAPPPFFTQTRSPSEKLNKP